MSSLAENLRRFRKEKGLTQKGLAMKSGVKQSTISEIETGVTLKTASIVDLAIALGVSSEELLTGKVASKQTQTLDDMSQSQSQTRPQHMNFVPPVDLTHSEKPRQTPVLSWVQAGDFSYVLSSDLSSVIDWIPYDPRAGQYGFALIVKGVSMEPDFKPDEYIYVNPTYQIDELNTGALVVMACDGDSEATFKKLISEDENYYLQPLNPNWQPQIMPLDHTCRLVGKVVGKYTRY